MSIFDHPGHLGSVRGTLFTVHHADWPAYPQGENFRTALLQLTAFPASTDFVAIDHIDQSALFVACVRGTKLDEPFSPHNFHIAIWYEDLVELDRERLVDGVVRTNEREFERDQWRRRRANVPEGAPIYFELPSGECIPLEEPDFESHEDEDFPDFREFPICPSDRIKVTPMGRAFVLQELSTTKDDVLTCLGNRISDLFRHEYYDACIREACVQLEHEIRVRTGGDFYGDKLVELFIDKARSDKRYLESYVRSLRQELRAIFKFIRNDFMHNLREVDTASALAMLFRIATVRSLLLTAPSPDGI